MKTAIAAAALWITAALPALAQPMRMVAPIGHRPPELTLGLIIRDAGPAPKLVLLLLAIATIAAIVVLVRKLRAGPKLSGGSTFLSSLRAGGPLLGLIGGAYSLLNVAIGVAVVGPVGINVVMPGLIEALLTAMVGMIVGVLAIAANWAVEARIDREVLRS